MAASNTTSRLRAEGRAFAHIARFYPEITALRRDLHAHRNWASKRVYNRRPCA